MGEEGLARNMDLEGLQVSLQRAGEGFGTWCFKQHIREEGGADGAAPDIPAPWSRLKKRA